MARFVSVLLCLLAVASRLHAQGGPPMITDDPGNPGPNSYEINLGWESERAGGITTNGLPLLDANYGIGDSIEITYESPWAVVDTPGQGSRSGWGDSLFGLKYRYFNGGDKGWQASVYPQFTSLTPGTNSGERGVADTATTLLLPAEFAKDFGSFAIDFDLGSILSNEHDARGWMGGFLIGKNLRENWEIDTELHLNSDLHVGKTELIWNTGTRITLNKHLILMLALGTDLSNTLGPRNDYLSYAGFQILLGKGGGD